MEQYTVLQEDIETFNTWISPVRINKANAAYEDLAKTQEGQLKILSDARSGNTTAADFLFNRLKKIIAKAFWKYFLGPDSKYHSIRIRSGDDKDFASMAYGMLLNAGEGSSPYTTFKASKFRSSADLIKQFGYYFYRYLQNEAMKMLRAEAVAGMTGNISYRKGLKKELSTNMQDIDAHNLVRRYDDGSFAAAATIPQNQVSSYANDEDLSTPDTFTGDIDEQEAKKAFFNKLKKENPKYFKVIQLAAQGYSPEDIASKLGISSQSVRSYAKDLSKMWKEFIGEE